MDFYWLFRVTEEFFMFQNPLQIILDSDRLVCGVGEGGRGRGEGGRGGGGGKKRGCGI